MRAGSAVGSKERKKGAVLSQPLAPGGGPPGPRSSSSQANVSASGVASVAPPMRRNGVPIGSVAVRAASVGVGTSLPVGSALPHVPPWPAVKRVISVSDAQWK